LASSPAGCGDPDAHQRRRRCVEADRRSDVRYEVFRDDDFLAGTFAPSFRAFDNPIAIACLRLVTFLPERPLRNVPW
jgi:hypothetical protein